MDKLKIYCIDSTDITNIIEEQILYFGKLDNSIINKNNTFIDLSQNEILNLIEYTDVEKCDFIYYPYKINEYSNINEYLKLSEDNNKKIVLLYNDDDDKIFNFNNSIFFRTSIYKKNKPENYYSLPAFCNDLKKQCNFFLRKKNEIPTIGFCGAITHPIRKIIIDKINNSNLSKNFLIRDKFWGGDVWGEKVRKEYIETSLNSDIIICPRGAGNFSYRFYETLCLGRIPLVIDTDMVFPFEDFIDYDNKIIKIKQENIDNIIQEIMSFWNNIDDYELFQKNLTFFWEKNLSPLGFINNLNLYKNEINNLLHRNS